MKIEIFEICSPICLNIYIYHKSLIPNMITIEKTNLSNTSVLTKYSIYIDKKVIEKGTFNFNKITL